MERFSTLYSALIEADTTREKIDALKHYLDVAPSEEAAWAIYLLSGKRPRRIMTGKELAPLAMTAANVPAWLFDECLDAVGDIVETATLLLPENNPVSTTPLHEWIEDFLLAEISEAERRDSIIAAWQELNTSQRYIFNKLLTGGFRPRIAKRTLVKAIAESSQVDTAIITHRLAGDWQPTPNFYATLMAPEQIGDDVSRPYPFTEIRSVDTADIEREFGDVRQWQVERTWSGVRVQIVKRDGHVFIWTPEEALVTPRYPEIAEIAIPYGTVLEGYLLPWKDGQLMPLGTLQKRVKRKNVSRKLMQDVPLIFMACDVMEIGGDDVRQESLEWRREQLESLDVTGVHVVEKIQVSHWDDVYAARSTCRELLAEGLMIKRKSAPYFDDHCWKWKAEAYKINAVLIYAQRGEGDQANHYTEYTFGVWDNDTLVPVAKTGSGLSDNDIEELSRFVRDNTVERFGPVRTVMPELVFEVAFDELRRSKRHKSGIAVQSPRVFGLRVDLTPDDADRLDTLRALLPDERT